MDILYLCRPDIVCPKNQKDIPMECEHAFGLSMVQHVITKDIPGTSQSTVYTRDIPSICLNMKTYQLVSDSRCIMQSAEHTL